MATGAERQPVQVDRGALNSGRRADACAGAGSRHTATISRPADRDNNSIVHAGAIPLHG
jgi:hypothetical protein